MMVSDFKQVSLGRATVILTLIGIVGGANRADLQLLRFVPYGAGDLPLGLFGRSVNVVLQ